MVTKQTGTIDCLTVRADAPVNFTFDALFLCRRVMASAFEGRRWLEMSEVSGSNLPILNGFVGYSAGDVMMRWDQRMFAEPSG